MNKIFALSQLPQGCALALATILAAPACAGEPVRLDASQIAPPAIDGAERAVQALPAVAAGTGDTVSIGGATARAVDLHKLAHERGRADTVTNDTKLNGDVANNSAFNVQTGSNTIDAGSFASMSGIPVVIQNSGANVLIQNATVINLQFQ
ncbi:hypothetical protein ACFPOU_05615 [Massilia jejuensis]|uniref:Minor curlin subunit n=1 Tax=Massilia jejuensis TaxID=648894 RepID=A0ABW0PEX1_9BURK